MRNLLCGLVVVIATQSLSGQTRQTITRGSAKTVFEGQTATVRLAPQLTTTIRLPEAVNSVVLGDPNLFLAEYSPQEPRSVFVKPVTSDASHTNLSIATVRGRQFILSLTSAGANADETESSVDLLVICSPNSVVFIDETFPTALVSETLDLRSAIPVGTTKLETAPLEPFSLEELLDRQRGHVLPKLFGERIRVGIGETQAFGAELAVSFSVINSGSEPVELIAPQVQLAASVKSGAIRRHTVWSTVQQMPIHAYRMSSRRIGPADRVDGVVVFERPPIKQSNEELLLQIADSATVDRPVLVPINFKANQRGEKP
jgi:hypothetical protein